MMDQVIIYIHGQGGNADEAKHYEALFENQKVIGIDYISKTPWERLRTRCHNCQRRCLTS